MIYLLWSLLNLFLVLSFFYFAIGLIFRGRKTIEPYFKPFVFVVLFFGFTGFLGSYKKKNEDKTLVIPMPLERKNYSVFSHLSNKMELTIYRDPETKVINQEFSKSSIHGLVMGLQWHHVMVSENVNELEVEGFWEWNLIGNRAFRNFRTYKIEAVDQVSKKLLP